MRRALILCLLTGLIFSACGTDNSFDRAALNAAVASFNERNAITGDHMLEISFSSDSAASTTLYYTKGTFVFDRDADKAYADFEQSWLGMSSAAKNYHSGGVTVNVTDGEVFTVENDGEEMFAMFPYCRLPECTDAVRDATVSANSRGTVYSYTRADDGFCKSIIGEDIYALVPVISRPQPEKTVYGDAIISCTVVDGTVVSFGCETDITLFDTPSYIPGGYSAPESEYTVKVHIKLRMNYSQEEIGEIPEYSTEN